MSEKINYSKIMLPDEPQSKAFAFRRINYFGLLNEISNKGIFLEIGPGNGEMLTVARDAGFSSLEAVDTDSDVINRLKLWQPDVNGILISEDINLSDYLGRERYTSIFACHLLRHIPHNKRLAWLEACFKILENDGILVLELPNVLCPLGGLTNYLGDPTHCMPLSSIGLSRLLSFSGFKSVKVRVVRPPFLKNNLFGILRWAFSILVGFFINIIAAKKEIRSPAYYVIARK